jgi:hypothetical protein
MIEHSRWQPCSALTWGKGMWVLRVTVSAGFIKTAAVPLSFLLKFLRKHPIVYTKPPVSESSESAMASYLSYFTSGNASNQPSQYGNQNAAPGAAAPSTWSSTFSSRIATLRKALTKDSEDDDPDYEDSSHVSNVLRAYYTEKGRTFPEWLPPDPKKPAPAPVAQQSMYNQYGGYGGSQYGIQQDYSRNSSASQGGLSDLWDSGPAAAPAPASQSLRAPRPTPQSLRSHDGSMSQQQGLAPSYAQQSSAARPLPSQRAGSFQNTPSANPGAMGSRDRLRARLQGGSSGRSSPAPQGQGSYSGSTNSYDSSGGGSPYVSASEPWSSGSSNPYHDSGPANTYTAPQRQRPGGLPSGPRGPR